MKKTIQSKVLLPIGCIVVGVFLAVVTFLNYEIWSPLKGPMPGFLPLVCSVLLAITGVFALRLSKNDKEPELHKENWFLVAAILAVMGGSYIIGFLPALFIFAFAWLRFQAKCSWKTTIITMLILLAMIIGIFDLWLEIPFDKGLIFRALFE